jgi:putative oxidoreductase
MKLDIGLLILRFWGGGMMLMAHGLKKITSFGAMVEQFPDPSGVGPTVGLVLVIFAEVFCATAILLGIKTRWASFPLLLSMMVASFIVHARDPWPKQEFALMYGVLYLVLMLTGGGRFALDRLTIKPR